jgi:hypothetical protein
MLSEFAGDQNRQRVLFHPFYPTFWSSELGCAKREKIMKTTKMLVLGIAVLLAGTCFAQEYSKFEASVDYSYARWNPSNFPSGTIPGTNQKFGNGHSLNGGGGTFVYNINRWIGIKADLQGYGSHGTSSFLIPPGNPVLPKGGAFSVSGNLFTYTFGPEVKLRAGRFNPYFQTLFGAAHSNVYKNLDSAICVSQPIVGGSSTCATTSAFRNPSSNAFAMVLGGGIDITLTKMVTFRAGEIDYLLTRFGTSNFSVGNQNGLRVVTGFVFTF